MIHRRRFTRVTIELIRCIAVVCACGALSALGCARDAGRPGRRAEITRTAPTPRTERASATLGLELVRWFIPLDPKSRADGIERIIAAGFASRIDSPLSSSGITLLCARTDRLPQIVDELGKSLAARRTVLGQADSFSDLAAVQLAEGTVLMAGGRPQRVSEGLLRLSMRGWCFPTVDAASARIELRLGKTSNRVASVSIDPSEIRERVRELPDGTAVLELAAGESLLLLETPVVAPEAETDKGPVEIAPPSRGAVLFRGEPFADRALVLVIEPGFADILPPSATPSSVP